MLDNILKRFRSTTTIRLFVWLVLAACTILLLVRFWLGNFDALRILTSVIEALLATFLASLGIAGFVKYFAPRDSRDEILIVEPRDLSEKFEQLLRKTKHWKYKGNFGRYFRTKVLGTLSDRAQKDHVSIDVECIIIDPRNAQLCATHATARNSVRTVDGKQNWTAEDVQIEVYSTILCCFIYSSTLNIKLGLLNYFEPQRFDISSSDVIVTREDRKAPAMLLRETGYFSTAANRDFSTSMRQASPVILTPNDLTLDAIDCSKALALLTTAELGVDKLHGMIAEICTRAASASNPYG